jgi:single-strand DNA-binding protein
MTPTVNRTELVGNLGNDPTTRFNAAGTLIVTTSIAVHTSYRQGETRKERTDWFRLVAFNEAGENLAHFAKGDRIRVVGRLQSSEYTDRDGQKRTSVELVVLHSEPAPRPRKAEDAEPAEPAEAEQPVEEPVAEPVAEDAQPVEPEPEPVAAKPRRRRKAA